jgi:pimeloyl-ACP methyl ester carboxylesterase
MKYLDNFHYQISGNPSGHKLVFLHGLMGSGANWFRIKPAFENEFHILTFDQRGHGRSFHPHAGFQPKDFAEDLRKILDELGWEKVILVGHSMGARNALEFSILFAQRVIALVMEDLGPSADAESASNIERLLNLVPTPFADRATAREFFDKQYPNLISWNPQPQVVSQFFYSNIEPKPDGTQDWRFEKEAILEILRAGRQTDRWLEFRQLKMPVLVVRGETSKDLPRDVFQRMLKELPAAQGVEIQGAGHWVHFDQPQAFIQTLKEFFDLKV